MRPPAPLLAFFGCLFLLCTLAKVEAAPKTQAGSEVVDFGIEAKESRRLFGTAVKNWEAAFAPKKLRSTLKGLASGKVTMSDALKQELYVVRKSSAIVRATFQLLDEGHQKPKALDRYVRAAGKLNDAINSGQHEKIPTLAKKTLQAMHVEAIRAEVKGFVPTSAKSFNGYLYTSMLFAEKASSSKKLKAPVYHQLRKEMTNLLVLFEPGRKMTPGVQRLHDRLHNIRLSMGDVHDLLVSKKSKDPKSYTSKKVKLTKMNRKDVRQVLRTIRVQKPATKAVHYDRWRANIKPGRGSSKAAPKKVR